ncbi:MAG: hypothetical protein EOO69_12820 [Moraxellaceae bacterium]|nr:MAG: hypothetical protein EOO69_12820 [Moraxellaceae bacterium]
MKELLTGICICPDATEIDQFTAGNYNPNEWDPYKLSNGNIIEEAGKPFKRIICDFYGGEDTWSGYIKGFIYTDGKFLGKMHYVAEAKLAPDNLNGSYILTPNGIELKGIWAMPEVQNTVFSSNLKKKY